MPCRARARPYGFTAAAPDRWPGSRAGYSRRDPIFPLSFSIKQGAVQLHACVSWKGTVYIRPILCLDVSSAWVTDMAETCLHSNMAGGPSDRRFSRWYVSDLANWQAGRYKTLSPEDDPER